MNEKMYTDDKKKTWDNKLTPLSALSLALAWFFSTRGVAATVAIVLAGDSGRRQQHQHYFTASYTHVVTEDKLSPVKKTKPDSRVTSCTASPPLLVNTQLLCRCTNNCNGQQWVMPR